MNTTRPYFLFSTTGRARAARRTTALLLAGAALAIAPLDSRAASATPPDLMAYQGFLVDANGNPLANTTPLNYPAIFRIYTASQGGTRLWSEQQVVTVDKGNFSVLLGQGTQYASETRPALSSVMGGADASDLYVGVTVTIDGSSQEILPRLRLMTSPYAFLATRAANLVQPNGTPVISYSGGQIQLAGGVNVSGTVTGNGSGLSSLSASSITTGTLSDARLSGNIARNNTGNTFAGNQRFNGLIGINKDPGTWLDIEGNLRAGNANGSFFVNGYPPGGGKVLLGIFTGSTGNGPQLRFQGPTGGGWTDIGQNGSASFVIEQNDNERLVVQPNGNVGIGTSTPGFPLTFGNVLGDKIAMWSNGANSYGFGIQGSTLQIHTDSAGAGVSIGYGSSAAMTETARFNGNGQVFFRGPNSQLNINHPSFSDATVTLQKRPADLWTLVLADGNAIKPGSSSWATFSDMRLKQDVAALSYGLKEISKLNTIRYHYRDNKALGLSSKQEHYGFTAQEVQQVMPEAVSTFAGTNLVLNVDLVYLASINAIKELNQESIGLRDENAAMKRRIADLEEGRRAYEDRLAALENLLKGTPKPQPVR